MAFRSSHNKTLIDFLPTFGRLALFGLLQLASSVVRFSHLNTRIMLAIVQQNPRTFALCNMHEGNISHIIGRIRSCKLAKRIGGAEFQTTTSNGHTVIGSGTHRECREALLAVHGINPMEVDGHTFTRKEEKRAFWRVNDWTKVKRPSRLVS